jgi:RNA polymerase sigma-70 factor (ECF subfamily)
VKGWLWRAVATTVDNGPPRTGIGRWLRRLPRLRDPGDERFQGPDEPYPKHWRSLPDVPPVGIADGPAGQQRLRRELQLLPPEWRAVLWARDGEHLPAEQVAAKLGLTVAQQRRILNRARAALRDALVEQPRPENGQ